MKSELFEQLKESMNQALDSIREENESFDVWFAQILEEDPAIAYTFETDGQFDTLEELCKRAYKAGVDHGRENPLRTKKVK